MRYRNRRIRELFGGRVVRPVNDQRLADDILARHEAPVAAVERLIAIVAHGEIVPRRHHHFAVLHVVLEHLLRRRIQRRVRIGREIVAVGIDVIRSCEPRTARSADGRSERPSCSPAGCGRPARPSRASRRSA